ncbi:DNA translocase FtsK [Flaviaesturariibacter flavus]|uniref:DNA translocase FtsK n=1 Tax=Flaviaesturariibacter flavus TaxID=2502780 RepID=UPI001FB447C7|nr:DNA translocase FtsK [Flaviaesturariibacter flavus]
MPAETPDVKEAAPAKPKTARKTAPRSKDAAGKDSGKFKKDREESIDFKKLARDERTWKIIGTLSLLMSIFLFIAFVSYFFTWKEDQDKVLQNSAGFLVDDELRVSNLLGRLGAWVAHFFIYRGFGISSLLFCTFFFVCAINLLFERKVFSVWRNLKYITFGLVISSVAFAFILPSHYQGGYEFPFGGRVGNMISDWLGRFIGSVGTGALLLVVGASYLIWQFNPSFKMPERKPKPAPALADTGDSPFLEEVPEPLSYEEREESEPVNGAKLMIAPGFEDKLREPAIEEEDQPERPNQLKGEGSMQFIPSVNDAYANVAFEVIEREEEGEPAPDPEPEPEPMEEELPQEKEIVADILHTHDQEPEPEPQPKVVVLPPKPEPKAAAVESLALEIKEAEPEPEPVDHEVLQEGKGYADLAPYDPALDLRDYKYPHIDLLEVHGSERVEHDPAELEANKNQIINTLSNYDISIQKISATIGPTVTLYEIVPAPGVRISRIKNLEDDIALSLAALGIRIIAPIPGRGTIGIEVPNHKKSVVSMRTMLGSEEFRNSGMQLPIAIGKKIDNKLFVADLATMPHLLMAGATGQGKSVGLNAILVSLLYKKHPSQLKFVLVDPKKVELSIYRHIEHHFLAKLPGEEEAIITDTKKVISTLNALCIEMDNRYDLLKEAGARNIKEYNEKFTKRRLNPQKGHQYLPFIVLVIDEFADLIMTAGKEVEMPIARLAQLARAIGIHLIIATQRPSVNIITGTIKANFPARIAFKVSSKIDSRTILDTGGAEQLIGKGDMLISYNGELVRLQCAFVDTPEVERINDYIADQRGYPQAFLLPEYVDEKELEKSGDFDPNEKDPLFEDAAKLIVGNQIGSTSLLQRRMKLGYNRAGRLMDQLERAGIVGPNVGSKAREVLFKTETELMEHLIMLG